MRAAAAAFRSERYLQVDGRPAGEVRGPLSGLYRGVGGRWIRLHCNFPHHEQGVLRLLGCGREREAVAKAVAGWDAFQLEERLAAAQMCAAAVRGPEEWRAHPQAKALADLPLLEILKIGESPPQPCGAGKRPLANVRVLDLTRVIAGPVCGRTLAAHGADVLLISAAHLPSILPLVIDTGLGKLSAQLDLRRSQDAEQLRELIREADVFCQAYRPEALAAFGLSPSELARLRPRHRVRHAERLRSRWPVRGAGGAASTAWCSAQAALRMKAARRREATRRRSFPHKRSIMRAASSRPSQP